MYRKMNGNKRASERDDDDTHRGTVINKLSYNMPWIDRNRSEYEIDIAGYFIWFKYFRRCLYHTHTHTHSYTRTHISLLRLVYAYAHTCASTPLWIRGSIHTHTLVSLVSVLNPIWCPSLFLLLSLGVSIFPTILYSRCIHIYIGCVPSRMCIPFTSIGKQTKFSLIILRFSYTLYTQHFFHSQV